MYTKKCIIMKGVEKFANGRLKRWGNGEAVVVQIRKNGNPLPYKIIYDTVVGQLYLFEYVNIGVCIYVGATPSATILTTSSIRYANFSMSYHFVLHMFVYEKSWTPIMVNLMLTYSMSWNFAASQIPKHHSVIPNFLKIHFNVIIRNIINNANIEFDYYNLYS